MDIQEERQAILNDFASRYFEKDASGSTLTKTIPICFGSLSLRTPF